MNTGKQHCGLSTSERMHRQRIHWNSVPGNVITSQSVQIRTFCTKWILNFSKLSSACTEDTRNQSHDFGTCWYWKHYTLTRPTETCSMCVMLVLNSVTTVEIYSNTAAVTLQLPSHGLLLLRSVETCLQRYIIVQGCLSVFDMQSGHICLLKV